MVEVMVDGDRVVFEIEGFDKLWAFRSRLEIPPRIIMGAVIGIVSVGILWLTGMLLNNLFVDRMSYEPDRIRAFQQSGYPTMKEYLKHIGWGPAPLLMAVAAVVGAIGGAVRRTSSPARIRES